MIKKIDLSGERRKISSSFREALKANFPFDSMREYQEEAMNHVMEAFLAGYKYVFLQAPTGFGKSAVAVALARKYKPSYILASTRSLQQQYAREKAFRTIVVEGKNNFPCLLSERANCEEGECKLRKGCIHKLFRGEPDITERYDKLAESARGPLWVLKGREPCMYQKQKCDGINHDYPVLNYAYFIYEMKYSGEMGRRNFIACDEAHNIENWLMMFINFSISDDDLKLINNRIRNIGQDMQAWIEYLTEWKELFDEELDAALEASEKVTGEKTKEYVKKIDALNLKVEKLKFLIQELQEDPDNWTVTYEDKAGKRKATFKPVFVRKWAGNIFEHGDRFLLQSATIIDPDSICNSLGLDPNQCIYIEVPSVFNPEKKPFFYIPRVKMSFKHMDESLPKLAGIIEHLIAKYPDKKGVIHTHSYKTQQYILKNLKSTRFMFNPSPKLTTRIFNQFIKSQEPMVLVTPSAYEGYDFKDDICRWQLLCKVPYPQLEDEQIKKRMKQDEGWYQYQAILRLVQTYGRGMRHENDSCDTYIFDSNFARFFRENKARFPGWFKESIKVLN